VAPSLIEANGPVGVFDSGLGGLAILFELERMLPRERFVYFADTLRCPWGSRPPAEIIDLSRAATETLLGRGAKVVVVACNSATTTAIDDLRATFAVPFVGTVPAVKPAASITGAGRIGVMATNVTVASGALRALMDSFAAHVSVSLYACPDRLVELVEAAVTDGDEVREVLGPIMEAARADGIDVLVLGCTHYTFLKGAITALAPGIALIDAGEPVARQVGRVLEQQKVLGTSPQIADVEYIATAGPETVRLRSNILKRSYLAHLQDSVTL